jgi:hypothetical protein
MRHAILTTFLAGAALLAADDKPRAFRFEKAQAGKLPAGWQADKTGKGDGSEWKVVTDDSAPSKSGHALAQTAKGPKPLFNLCVAEDTSGKDVEVSVAFKAVAGEVDQGGGVVWRYQDANNYYVARHNPLEDNFRVYKVVAGKRTQLGSADVDAPAGKWHTIRVVHQGNRIQCYLNGKLYLDVTDDTIPEAGRIGLWTKADAQTYFADLKVSGK